MISHASNDLFRRFSNFANHLVLRATLACIEFRFESESVRSSEANTVEARLTYKGG
jgi:hypothetical protein